MTAPRTLPWRAADLQSPEGVWHIRDAEGYRVALAYDEPAARLIAAAPALRGALRFCLEALTGDVNAPKPTAIVLAQKILAALEVGAA